MDAENAPVKGTASPDPSTQVAQERRVVEDRCERSAWVEGAGGEAMKKKNGMGPWTGVALLVLAVTLLALPNRLEAQRATGTVRVRWLEGCCPGPPRPPFGTFPA